MVTITKQKKFRGRHKRHIPAREAYRVTVTGKVQGVGFRPAVFRFAKEFKVRGWVANNPSGALLEIEGSAEALASFLGRLQMSLPAQAQITGIEKEKIPFKNFQDFKIRESKEGEKISAELPPDIATCPNCLQELRNPADRRFRYPFINCTDCGPRFSIVRELPYDRPKTTMSTFPMCPDCLKEYNDPENRRFHAQPNACPVCGPQIELLASDFKVIARKQPALFKAIDFLRQGKIIAIKSLGGYHIACDAANKKAVLALRHKKNRPHKPFALMLPDIEAVKKLCEVNAEEEKLLLSSAGPIVLLRRISNFKFQISDDISPGNAYIGIMLPYTPLHHLLFSKYRFQALVMTSGNKQDEPICITEKDAQTKLKGIADYFLVHNRPIHNRCDDSILQVPPDGKQPVFIRRSRGYVPEPVTLSSPNHSRCVLGAGAELKNTLCLTRDNNAYVSQYIGELDNQESLSFYKEVLDRYKKFLKVEPKVIAHDLHPDYLSTILAKQLAEANKRITLVPVQHHYAHIASVMAEHKLETPILGFAFDGLGYGLDGNIWGGECVWAYNNHFERLAHFEYFGLPGGDIATKEIWRLAVSLMRQAGIDGLPDYILRKHPHRNIRAMIEKRFNTPLCCSAGRIFDAVAAILGLRGTVSFEAQAAMELEAVSLDNGEKIGYNFYIKKQDKDEPAIIIWSDIIRGVWNDKKAGVSPGAIGAKFHITMADIIHRLAVDFGRMYGVKDVALSGGVFQNRLLLSLAEKKLTASGIRVHYNKLVPANDGGISLGQAWVAAKQSQI